MMPSTQLSSPQPPQVTMRMMPPVVSPSMNRCTPNPPRKIAQIATMVLLGPSSLPMATLSQKLCNRGLVTEFLKRIDTSFRGSLQEKKRQFAEGIDGPDKFC